MVKHGFQRYSIDFNGPSRMKVNKQALYSNNSTLLYDYLCYGKMARLFKSP